MLPSVITLRSTAAFATMANILKVQTSQIPSRYQWGRVGNGGDHLETSISTSGSQPAMETRHPASGPTTEARQHPSWSTGEDLPDRPFLLNPKGVEPEHPELAFKALERQLFVHNLAYLLSVALGGVPREGASGDERG